VNGRIEEDLTVKHYRIMRRKHAREKPIRTTFMELIQELSNLTSDDSLVVAAVKRILDTHNVRLSQSLLPVRLVTTGIPIRAHQKSAWNKGRSVCA
jgi:hypothetical protein